MKEREENVLPQDKDPHLDIPAEANTEEHINFVELEENSAQAANRNKKDETTERQKQWKQGIQEGRKARNDQ